MQTCFYCNRQLKPGDEIYRLFESWQYCKWMCVLLDCLEVGHTFDEIMAWNHEARLDLYYTELEEDEEESQE
jgi:hypothetical protein